MKVRLLVPLAGAQPFNKGDEFTCADAAEAKRMIEAGMAVPIAEKKIERAVKPAAPERRKAK